jgi:hypothetical protein
MIIRRLPVGQRDQGSRRQGFAGASAAVAEAPGRCARRHARSAAARFRDRPGSGRFARDPCAGQSAGNDQLDRVLQQELAARSCRQRQQPEESPAAGEWSLGEAKVTGGALRWLDESHGKPFNASVEGIDLGLAKLDSKGGFAGRVRTGVALAGRTLDQGDAFSVKGGRLDLAKREVLIDEVAPQRGTQLLMRRAADGSIDFVQPPVPARCRGRAEGSWRPWQVTVAKYRSEDLGLRFEDAAVSPAATHTIEGMRFDAENLSTEAGSTAKVTTRFRLNRKGEVEAAGSVKALPLDADLKLAVGRSNSCRCNPTSPST